MISVIVPAYNAEKYLHECVESVFSQSMTDWELLLVNDGSTDSTPAICDEYALKDPRVRVIHQANGGLSAARNTGLKTAKGEYLCFLDSDDILDPRFLETTYNALAETDADMAAVSFNYFSNKKPFCRIADIAPPILLEPSEAIKLALYQRPPGHTTEKLASSAWAILYRSWLWNETCFRKGQWYEDLDIFYRVWEKARRIVFIPTPLLGYRQHGESFLHTFSLRRADVLDVTDRMNAYFEHKGKHPEMRSAAETRRFAAHWNILLIMLRHRSEPEEREQIREIKARCRRVIRQLRGMVLRNSEARLKDRLGALAAYLPGIC